MDTLDRQCEDIIVEYRNMRRAERLKLRNENTIGADVRSMLGFSVDLDEKSRAAIRSEADRTIKAVMDGETDGIDGHIAEYVMCAKMANENFDRLVTAKKKNLVKMVRCLPAWEFVKPIRGAAENSVYSMIGECGNLSNYANPAKVWKRLGLHVYNGSAPSTWRKGIKKGMDSDGWIEMGYSPARRSSVFVWADSMMKMNKDKYREIYEREKEKKLSLESDEWPRMRCHLHGLRVMSKKFVADFWGAWNGRAKLEHQLACAAKHSDGATVAM